MIDEDALNDEMRAKLRRYREHMKVMADERKALIDLGILRDPEVASTVQQREDDSVLWDKLSPKEKTDLYYTNRELWQQLLDAKRDEGDRKLRDKMFGGGR